MPSAPEPHRTADVPTKIFTEFLEKIEVAGLPPAKRAALRKTLLENPNFSDEAIRNALMAEETVP